MVSWFRVKEGGANSPSDGTDIRWMGRDGQSGFDYRLAFDEVNPTWSTLGNSDLAFQLIDNNRSDPVPVPEPASVLLLAVGGMGFARSRWRQDRAHK
jgi:hypothetical protein